MVLAGCAGTSSAPVSSTSVAVGAAASKKPTQAAISNVVADGAFASDAGWVKQGGASFDGETSRSPGTGSFRLPGRYSEVHTSALPVAPGVRYTYSAYIRSSTWPSGNVTVYPQVVSATGAPGRQIGEAAIVHATSKAGAWEEVTVTFVPGPDVAFVRLHAVRFEAQPAPGDLWVDDVVLTKGLVFREEPSAKVPFNGSRIRVDAQGNFERLNNGKWEAYFPFCAALDQNRPTFANLAAQGINCDAWGGHIPSVVAKAKAAGMLAGFQLAQFTNTKGFAYSRFDDLRNQIEEIKRQGLADSLLWFYIDNEESYAEYGAPKAATEIVRALDVDASGVQMHPIFVLQGNYGVARGFRSETGASFSDVVGTYVPGGETAGAGGSPGSMLILRRQHAQTTPASICQINHGVGVGFRARLYGCLAHGGRGVSFWADNVPAQNVPPLEQQPWWPEVPQLRKEIDAILPILRSPTDQWIVTSSTDNQISPVAYGTKFHNKTGYLIIANDTQVPQTVTFGFGALGYQVVQAKELLSGGTVTSVQNNQMTVTIPPAGLGSGSAVFELQSATPPPPSTTARPPATTKATKATTTRKPTKKKTKTKATTKPKVTTKK